MTDLLEVELTDGAVRNGYIRIPRRHPLFPAVYWAKAVGDEAARTLELVDDQGSRFQTWLLEDRSRLKQRFVAYFRDRGIKAGTRVRITRLAEGRYKMEFQMEQKTLRDYFEEYKKNPRTEWIAKYRARCAQVDGVRRGGEKALDEAVLRELWFEPSNGIASVGQGFMYEREFNALKAELPGVTLRILTEPTPAVLDETFAWARKAKSEERLDRIFRAVIYRVFAAAAPQRYSSIVDERALTRLISTLNQRFALGVPVTGNWAEKNDALMKAIKARGLEGEDVFLVNTFVWRLTELLDESEEDEVDESAPEPSEGSSFAGVGPRNVIFYGPPGTGKTRMLQRLLKQQYTNVGRAQPEEAFLREQLQPLGWFEVIALVMLDLNRRVKVADVVEHRFYKAKAAANERTTNLVQNAWYYLQAYTVADSKTVNQSRRAEPGVFDKTGDSLWYIVDGAREHLGQFLPTLENLREGPRQEGMAPRYEFVTFHQSYGYEEFVEGLRPVLGKEAGSQVQYEIRPGAFLRLCRTAEADPANSYAIVIDEINRGNISKIFGELITLIEPDKRKGMDSEAQVKLAYSGDPFSVPRNVHVIGSMNTADRSLALVDTALRRRFEFVEIAPDPSVLKGYVVSAGEVSIDLQRMLYAMNRRIEALYDRDHTIGHAYFTTLKGAQLSALAETFKNRIIPLLEEYFFEDWEKIRLVLGDNQKAEKLQFVKAQEVNLVELFGARHGLEEARLQMRFVRNPDALNDPLAYVGIYQPLS